jgi:hypothetical protein
MTTRLMAAVLLMTLVGAAAGLAEESGPAGDAALGSRSYEQYETPETCATCHVDISRQHEQAMMSQA